MLKISVYLQGHEVLCRDLPEGQYLVGRAPDADLLLDDPALAERHANLTVGPDGITLADLGPEPSIRVGSAVTAEARPQAGQGAWLGPYELRWQPAAPQADAGDRTVVFSEPDTFTDQATVVLPAGGDAVAIFSVREGGLAQDVIEVRGRARLGRAGDCEVVLAAGTVSRAHAEVEVTPDGVTVRDLGSTSGILVNGSKVERSGLKPGDTLRLGEVLLELTEAPGSRPAPAAAAPAAPAAPAASAPAPEPAAKPSAPKPAKKKKPAKAKKPAKQKKPKKKAAPPPGAKPQGSRRRALLYGGLAVALVVLLIAAVMRSGRKSQPATPAVDSSIARSQERAESEQRQRMVVINLTKARRAMSTRDYAEAKQFLQGALAVDPKNAEAKQMLDQADAAMAEAETKRRQAEQEEAAKAGRAAELMKQAQEAQKAQDWPRVVELGKQALTLNPKDGDARAMVLEAQAAIDTAERQARQREETADARRALCQKLLAQAKAQEKKGRLLTARDLLQRAALAEPDGPGGAQAQKALARVEPKIKARAETSYKKGVKALKRGHLETAVTALNQALAADPGHAGAAKALAQARKKAAKLATKLYQEGQVHASLGQMKKACAKWRRALKLLGPGDAAYAKVRAKLTQCGK